MLKIQHAPFFCTVPFSIMFGDAGERKLFDFKCEETFGLFVKRAEFDRFCGKGNIQFHQTLVVVSGPVDLFAVGKYRKAFHDRFRRLMAGGVKKIVGGQIEVSIIFQAGKIAVKWEQGKSGKTHRGYQRAYAGCARREVITKERNIKPYD